MLRQSVANKGGKMNDMKEKNMTCRVGQDQQDHRIKAINVSRIFSSKSM